MTTVAEGGLLESFGESALQETFDVQKLKAFLASASERFLKVVVISSGGTIVPLEKKAVRFIDNFSTGTRGALCAERFLQYDEAEEQQVGRFAVIFLTREGTKRPFFWNIDVTRLAETCQITSDRICVKDELMAKALEDFKKTQDRLFVVQFKTVQEYLANLRSVAILVRPFRKSALFFLAAAVSDFFVPESNLPTHKIQSSSEDLTINLKKVPKCLGLLRHEWAPEAFIVSFKVRYVSLLQISWRIATINSCY